MKMVDQMQGTAKKNSREFRKNVKKNIKQIQ